MTFAFGKDNADPEDEKIIPDQYKFRLNYCPTDDSLSIQVMSALYKLQNDSKPWRTLVTNAGLEPDERPYGGIEGTNYVVAKWTDKAGDKPNPADLKYHFTNWVKLQDLEAATELSHLVLAVAMSRANTLL